MPKMQEHFSAGAWMARRVETKKHFLPMSGQFPAVAWLAPHPENEGALIGGAFHTPRSNQPLVMMPARTMDVTMLALLVGRRAHVDDLDREMQRLAGHRMIEVHVNDA